MIARSLPQRSLFSVRDCKLALSRQSRPGFVKARAINRHKVRAVELMICSIKYFCLSRLVCLVRRLIRHPHRIKAEKGWLQAAWTMQVSLAPLGHLDVRILMPTSLLDFARARCRSSLLTREGEGLLFPFPCKCESTQQHVVLSRLCPDATLPTVSCIRQAPKSPASNGPETSN